MDRAIPIASDQVTVVVNKSWEQLFDASQDFIMRENNPKSRGLLDGIIAGRN